MDFYHAEGKMKRDRLGFHQDGIAMLGILFVFTFMSLGMLLSAWNSRQTNELRERATQAALQQAKDALIGYAVAYGGTPLSPINLGRLPCPENVGSIGTPLEGQAQGSCSTGASRIGRLPWRTLKTGHLVDGNGTPLWYAISPGFSSPPINSNSIGQLNLDGVANAAVAIIIAPGPPLNSQQRSEPTAGTPPQPSDYLDLTNPTGLFVSQGPSATFNDRIMTITHAELFGAVNQVVLAEVRGLDDQAPNLPVRGLRSYFKDNGEFPWAANPGSGVATLNKTSGGLPYNDLNIYYLGNSTWLSANNWLPLVGYTRVSANQAQIQLGTSTMTVLPCTMLPCP